MKLFAMPRLWIGAWALVAGSLLSGPAVADDPGDHERARAALQAGEILPLQKVLERVQRSHPGDVLEVELEREGGRWVYELKLLQRGGSLLRLDVDARTAEVLLSRPRGHSQGASSEPVAPQKP
jgi:Peptidase propeptide and YPEB domain